MKKLMIVAAALLCGVMAQASTVAWTITNVKDSTGAAFSEGSVYVFFVAGDGKADTSSWDSLAEKGATAINTALAGANYTYKKSDLKSTVAAGTLSYNATTAGAALSLETVGLTASTKYSAYAVIFDTEAITDASHFYVTAASNASTTYDASSSLTKSYALTATSSATAANWKSVGASSTDVPEPTSGLLMLLGMAGLALRRKRA